MGLEVHRETGTVPTIASSLLDHLRGLTGYVEKLSADQVGYVSFPCTKENPTPIRLEVPQTGTALILDIRSYDGIPQPGTLAHVAVIPSPDTHGTNERFFDLFVARDSEGLKPEALEWNKLAAIASDNGKVTVKYDEHEGEYSTIDIPSGTEAGIRIITRSNQWILEGEPGTEIRMPELV